MPARSPEQIRASVQETRRELEFSLNDLQGKVTQLTDWRGQLETHKREVTIAAGVAGFVIGGGIAAVFGLFRR